MGDDSGRVRAFFDDYQRAVDGLDDEFFGSAYAETFMFAGPAGAQSVKRDDFLKVLPKRAGFFEAVGLKSTKLEALEATRLDDYYLMARATWNMRYEQDPERPIDDETSATYLLLEHDDSLRIVFQLDHQDLMQRVKELGLVPVSA